MANPNWSNWPTPWSIPEGLGANIGEWSVLVDETQVPQSTYDRRTARELVRRWNPAHCRGYLCIKATTGDSSGVWSDNNSAFDGCIWAQ